MTIIIAFHQSGYRTFKHYYLQQVSRYLRAEFPDLVSYNRFRLGLNISANHLEMLPVTL